MYWAIRGYVKAVGKAACDALTPFIFHDDFPLECKANIILQLSKATNNSFEQGKSLDPGLWKESDIDYEAIRNWAEQGFPCGNGYAEPVRHVCLDFPETAAEEVYAKLKKAETETGEGTKSGLSHKLVGQSGTDRLGAD